MDSIRSNSSGRPLWLIIVAGVGVGYMLWSLLFSSSPVPGPLVTKAVAVLSGDVSGTISFIQSSPTGPVKVTGQLTGLAPDAQRGFHIHALGDLTNGCTSTSSHYNPLGMNHGAPTDSARHVGDLGNIATDSNGVAKLNIEDKIISLNGLQSIIGRAVVVHMGTDDLGRGNNEESLKTGNAGGRAACGVIGIAA